MSPGERLEVWLDAGEPIEQVPHSLKIAGYTEQVLTAEADYFKLSILVPQVG